MAKSANQKRKLLVLADILQRETDEQHPLTLEQLRRALAARDIRAERKSLYDDLEQLRLHGIDVVTVRDRQVRYYCGQRQFDLPELKLLVDVVQSSKFLTHRKSSQLIGKLESLTSQHLAGQLHRQVLVAGRIKHMNESIYYTVDSLQTAITEDQQITFNYFEWGRDKQRRLRHSGAVYRVSPWALVWDDENYYLVAFDSASGEIRHYRVDRMLQVAAIEERREGEEVFKRVDVATYSRKTFGMFGGAEKSVVLECAPWAAGIILDRFGQDVSLIPRGEGFRVRVSVVASPPFFGWLTGLGDGVRLTEPAELVEEYRTLLRQQLAALDGE